MTNQSIFTAYLLSWIKSLTMLGSVMTASNANIAMSNLSLLPILVMASGIKTERDYAKNVTTPTLKKEMSVASARRAMKEILSCVTYVCHVSTFPQPEPTQARLGLLGGCDTLLMYCNSSLGFN